MNRVLTASSLFAASLALIPTASQAESDVKYMNVMDSSAVHPKTANLIGLNGYDGPVVIVQTERREELENGYVAAMMFSESSLGPIEQHPMLELIDGEMLEGVPMFLTDRIDRFNLVDGARLSLNPNDVAGVIDMQWAADDVFDQLDDGIGEGDYLIVTHGPATTAGTEDSGLSQEVFAAYVFEPQGANSMEIKMRAGVPFSERLALVVLHNDEGDIAAGFDEDAEARWIENGPAAADQSDSNSDENADGDVEGADSETQEEESQSEGVIDGRSLELPGNLGGSMDLPEFTPSPRSPVRDAATFAPATHRAVYRR